MEKTGSKHINELISAAVGGDGTAFTVLWDTYIDQLRSYIRSVMHTQDDFFVDDICSRSFEKAFRQIGNYDPSKSQFSTWLKVIAHNTALDTVEQEARAKRGYVWIDDDSKQLNISEIKDDIDTPLDSIIKNEDQEETQGYIDGLPDLYREIARKRLVDGLQYKEIAEETGLELNTVRTRIRRAKAMIEKMKKEETNGI